MSVDNRIQAMRDAIQTTLNAISDGREQVQTIADGTQQEVQVLEQEYEAIQVQVSETIDMVEKLERDSRLARQRLVTVNKTASKYSEAQMKEAYDQAYELQNQLGQWQEREVQLRLRRDEIARRLKAVRAIAQQAEVLMLRFGNAAGTLGQDFSDLSAIVESAHLHNLMGVRMLQMQEDERRQLAQRLHDGPMQNLASLSMRVQSNVTSGTGNGKLDVEIPARLGGVLAELRQVVFDLRPPLLDDLGLVPTLKRYAAQWSDGHRTKSKVSLVGLESPLNPTEKITLFRTVQEALLNVAEHAKASSVDILLTYTPDRLIIRVIDDGVGIGAAEVEWNAWVETGRLGLMICRERMAVLGGALDILPSSSGTGTCVQVTLPIERGGISS